MNIRVKPGLLRRELRFSKSIVKKNLENHSVNSSKVAPLLESLLSPSGLISIPSSDLLLVDMALGLSEGCCAVELVGELISVKTVPADTGISYGFLSRTSEQTNLGLVALGFSDGIPRSATNRFSVGIQGVSHPGVGRMAMDQCVIDLGTATATSGSEVHFFTEHFSLKDWAAASGSSPLEIVGRITERVTRIWSV